MAGAKALGLEQKKGYRFRELVDWYLSLQRTAQIRSISKIREHGQSLKETFGTIKADEIKPSMVEAYQQKKDSLKLVTEGHVTSLPP